MMSAKTIFQTWRQSGSVCGGADIDSSPERAGKAQGRKVRVRALALGTMLALTGGMALSAPAAAQNSISKIQATYYIYLGGFYLGDFRFLSTFRGNSYTFTGQTHIKPPIISLFFDWKGRVSSNGTVQGNRANPKSYSFTFRSSKKSGRLNMTFANGNVVQVVERPHKGLSRKHVPVKPEHLRGVVDPMSALMMIKRGRSLRTACNQKIPVFDGKQRFDLKFSYKGMVRVSRNDTGAYAGPVVVCRVRYQPISGYKPSNKTTQYIAKSRDIEIWLMPLPRSNIFVPYRINLPTPAGMASVKPRSFQIRHRSGRRVALIRN